MQCKTLSQLKPLKLDPQDFLLTFWQCPSVAQYLDILHWLLKNNFHEEKKQ